MTIVSTSGQPVRTTSAEPERWQTLLREAIRDPLTLCEALGLPERFRAPAQRAASQFPVFAPRGFVARMRPGDPSDPLLRQVLPLEEECQSTAGFDRDPVGDRSAEVVPGLLQKYSGRALLITTGACAVHCRYCFRRHYPYSEAPVSLEQWRPALDRLRRDSSLEEVLLSGGDPWTLVDHRLASLLEALNEISHVRRVRFHTRLPIVLPERVTGGLLDCLHTSRATIVIVVHANHPAELVSPVDQALVRLVDAGFLVLNQSVLLRGVNDDVRILTDLSRRLVELRVVPYYLHQLDRVQGASHFEVSDPRAAELLETLRTRLPGYAVPRLVREVAGAASKIPLA